MKIRISKTKWNEIGRFAGWVGMHEFMEKQNENVSDLDSPLSSFKDDDEIFKIVEDTLRNNGMIDSDMAKTISLDGYSTTKNTDSENCIYIHIKLEPLNLPENNIKCKMRVTVLDELGHRIETRTLLVFNSHTIGDINDFIRKIIIAGHNQVVSHLSNEQNGLSVVDSQPTFKDGFKDKNGMPLPDGWDQITKLQKDSEKIMKDIHENI